MMAERLRVDEHAPENDDAELTSPSHRVKRRNLIAGAAALAVAVLAKQSPPVGATTTVFNNGSFSGAVDTSYPDAVQGYAGGPVSWAAGVAGRNNDLNGIGVSGTAPSGIGVSGGSTSSIGVSGASVSGAGLVGQSQDSFGAYGISTSSFGVYGQSTNNWGVYGYTPNQIGVVGNSYNYVGVCGFSGSGYGACGLLGYAFTQGAIAVGASAISPATTAGQFNGDVYITGKLAVSGAKASVVPHPDGSHRLLYAVESPESWFMDFGDVSLSGGKVTIALDKDFAAVVDTSGYRVFVTAKGDCNGLFVTGETANGFTVQEAKGGTSNAPFAYCVVARRKDVEAARLAKVTLPKITDPTNLPDLPNVPKSIVSSTTPPLAPGVAATPPPKSVPSPPSTPTTPSTTPSATPSGPPAALPTPRASGTSPGTGTPVPPRR